MVGIASLHKYLHKRLDETSRLSSSSFKKIINNLVAIILITSLFIHRCNICPRCSSDDKGDLLIFSIPSHLLQTMLLTINVAGQSITGHLWRTAPAEDCSSGYRYLGCCNCCCLPPRCCALNTGRCLMLQHCLDCLAWPRRFVAGVVDDVAAGETWQVKPSGRR